VSEPRNRTKYTYDAEDRVITASNGTSGSSSYAYDAEGRRIQKTTSAGGTVNFLYDLAGHEIAQTSAGAGSWMRGEIYAGGRHVATYYNSTTYFIHADWLGTERARSNVSGALCESITSLAYGDAMTTSGSCGDPSPMHFSGKEHDTETGLENFGARYDASSMGRFMSPDPLQISKKKFIDPQQWNMYSYTRNNPLHFVDPTGKSIELMGDDEERKRQLQALQKAAGKAGSYLYDNVDKKTGKHYVGIYTNGPDGKGPSFNSINAVSNKLGGIIQDSRVATVQFVDPGTLKAGQQVGPAPGMSPAVTFAGSNAATVFITRGTLGTFPGTLAADGKSETISIDEVLTHELGHVDSKWFHDGTDTNGDAVRIENQVRQEDELPMRIGHSEPYDVPLSDMPF
jgi:RHS repeat-associated protein